MEKNDLNTFLTYLQSEETAQHFLYQSYKNVDNTDARKKSYDNCHAFIHYLNHGLIFYESRQKFHTVVDPILLFYGMIHLLKAVLLVKRPHYPESTKILAHGVSSRKRKKKAYSFLHDEVNIKNNGLFPYFSEHLFSIKRLQINKIKMNLLFSLIPEMMPLYIYNKNEPMVNIGTTQSHILNFPLSLLDEYHLTKQSFLNKIKVHLPTIKDVNTSKSTLSIRLAERLFKSMGPFFIHSKNDDIYFPIKRNNFFLIHEIMIHYLILYNLSMLSRYETEWWGELLNTKTDLDYPFIIHFLQLTSEKVPLLLGQELYYLYNNI